jgi:hypothetical protein
MKLQPCFEPPKHLEEIADLAERRKREAIQRLRDKLGDGDQFGQAIRNLIDADKRALQEKGK